MIPDFIFDGWPEVGICDYTKLTSDMVEASKKPYKYDKAFWIGSTLTHPTRETLCSLSEKDDRILALSPRNSRFIGMLEHVDYKYLIDIQGRGYSGRFKIL